MKIKQTILFVLLAITILSCKKDFENLRINPNNPSISSADVNLYLNQVQVSFNQFRDNNPSFDDAANDFGEQLTRMQAFITTGGLYSNIYVPQYFDNMWTFAYTGVFKHADALIPQAIDKKLYFQAGMAQILKAYTAITLVDYFGDVPYTEADKGGENTNPKADKAQDVYVAALGLIDSAISNFEKPSSETPTNDLFYQGDETKWIKFAKTLKLRYYLTTRLVDAATSKAKITELVDEDDLVNSDADEFVFTYGTQQNNPDTRHPRYVNNYISAGGALEYVGTYFLWSLTQEKGLTDPRTRYYVYRQNLTSEGWDAFTLPCSVQPRPAHYTTGMPFCILPNGYWGRDHGDATGIPPDGDKRTTFGVYPAGGNFDNSDEEPVSLGDGARGAGISPIWMASFTAFAKAEAALTLQTPGDPKELLEAGVRASIERVLAFPAEVGITVPDNRIPTEENIDAYVDKVLSLYDAATTDDAKLNVIMKEWYLALWGNGLDAYNNYRRTAKPDNFQFMIAPDPGNFIRTFYYPAVFADLNANGSQKQATNVKTFWDINPDNLYR